MNCQLTGHQSQPTILTQRLGAEDKTIKINLIISQSTAAMATCGGSRSSRSTHKISTFELRERLKKSRDESTVPVNVGDSCQASNHSLSSINSKKSNLLNKTPERRRTKKILIKRKDGSMVWGKTGDDKKAERKNSIKDSLQKYDLSQRNFNKESSSDPYADDKSLDTTCSFSVGELCPPKDVNTGNCAFSSKANSSLEMSLDLSFHRVKSAGGDISSAASEEQWARFKLLGRTGLGEINVSSAVELLIDRNFQILRKTLKNIVAVRDDISSRNYMDSTIDFQTGHLLDEVQKTIEISTAALTEFKRDPGSITLKPKVEEQLRDYITVISAMYRNNAFHNFEHASTVLAAVTRLKGQVKRADDLNFTDMRYGCGVTSDPWTQFALVFSALIHDVDHAGVSNAQLIKEKSLVAGAYKNRSVAEQNSIELAWNLLMEPCYKDFRETIFVSPSECSRFRGLVVTAVMATDIADKELAALRKGRAAEAINADAEAADEHLVSRKATYVMETLIQAADISHTMLSFPMYKKWNHRLFREMYGAYKSGRAEKDPSEFWYNGEFGFFDFYIIPLCKKLKECGVSEKASNDYLTNAMNNRKTWETLGKDLVAGYVKQYEEERRQDSQGTSSTDPYDSEESPLHADFSCFGGDSSDSSSSEEDEHARPLPPPLRRGRRGSSLTASPQAKKDSLKKNVLSESDHPVRIKRLSAAHKSLADESKKIKKLGLEKKDTRKVRRIVYKSKGAGPSSEGGEGEGEAAGADVESKAKPEGKAIRRGRRRSKSIGPGERERSNSTKGSATSHGSKTSNGSKSSAASSACSKDKKPNSSRGRVTTRKNGGGEPTQSRNRSRSVGAEGIRQGRSSERKDTPGALAEKKTRLRSLSLESKRESLALGDVNRKKEKRGSKKTKPKVKKTKAAGTATAAETQ